MMNSGRVGVTLTHDGARPPTMGGSSQVVVEIVPTGDVVYDPPRKPILPTVIDGKNGTYTITFTPNELQVGPYAMTIDINGAAMFAEPVTIDIARTGSPAVPHAADGHARGSPEAQGRLALALAAVDHTNDVLWAVLGTIAALMVVGLVGVLVYKHRAKVKEMWRIEGMRGSVNDDIALPKTGSSVGYSLLAE